MSCRFSAIPCVYPAACFMRLLLIAALLSTTSLAGIARADDPQVPAPPAGGWPSFPRPVTRVEIPSACGTFLHNLWYRTRS